MFIIPIQELDEIVSIISGVVMPRHSPLMTRQNCKSSPGVDYIDEKERDDPPDPEKIKVGLYF